MKRYQKQDFPVDQVRRFLEPGPVVLVSSAHRGQRNIMTLGWHMVLEFSPSLIACCIAPGNHSFELVRRSKQCVINLPTAELLDTVVAIGNSSGAQIDKFAHFGLTAAASTQVEHRASPSVMPASSAACMTGGRSTATTCSCGKWCTRMWRARPRYPRPCITVAMGVSCSLARRYRGGACSHGDALAALKRLAVSARPCRSAH